jgi:hypothetical protein
MHPNEWWKTGLQPPVWLLIGQARKSTEVAPIGDGVIISETARQLLRGLPAKSPSKRIRSWFSHT